MADWVVARGRSRAALWRSMEKSRPVAENGDSFLVCGEKREVPGLSGREGWLFAVADGLGGEGNDDIASQTAVGALGGLFRAEVPMLEAGFSAPDGWLRVAYDQVNREVCAERQARKLRGMYTTLTSALLSPEPDGIVHLYPANIGDSRMYLLRNRELRPLTRDDGEGGFISRVIGDPHVFGQSYLRFATTIARTPQIEAQILGELEQVLLRREPEISSTDVRPLAELFLTILEGVYPVELAPAYSRPLGILFEGFGQVRFRALVDALADAYEGIASRLAPVVLQPGDRLLLCSDGISNAFSDDFLQEVLGLDLPDQPVSASLEAVLDCLLTTVGRVDDDRTGVVVHVGRK